MRRRPPLPPAPLREIRCGLGGDQRLHPGLEPPVTAVLDPQVEVVVGGPPLVAPGERGRQVDVRAADVGLEARPVGQGEAALQLFDSGGIAAGDLDNADVVEREDQGLGVIDPLGELDGANSPDQGRLGLVGKHRDLRDRRVCSCELGAGRKLFEGCDRVIRGGPCLVGPGDADQ